MAEHQALHLLALPRTGQQDLRRQGAVLTHAEILQPGSRTLRLAATTVGRSDTALGAFYRRLSLRAGTKAVTATARSYKDPGADQYEQQYRSRVLANLQRRAKSLGFALQAIPSDAIRLFLRKAAACFPKEST